MHRFATITGAAVFLVALPLLASEAAIHVRGDETLRPGSVVEVTWEHLPARVNELEFLLVGVDRRDEIVRLTPQLDPRRGSFEWLVPALSMTEASLVLRAGIDGEEIEIARSRTFAIAGDRDGEPLVFRDGEWWLSPLGRSTTSRVLRDGFSGSERRRSVAAQQSRRRFSAALPRIDVLATSLVRTAASPSPEVAVLSRAPLLTPQRK